MKDLISRKAAINALRRKLDKNAKGEIGWFYNTIILNNIEVIERLRSADAVPVVRCKECKHSEPWYSNRRRCFLWCETGNSVWDDGYCCYGERNEDERTD